MSFWRNIYRTITGKSNRIGAARDPRAIAYLAFALTEAGQKEARLRGMGASRDQILQCMIERSALDVFNVESDGTLLAATYTGAVFGHHLVRRSPLLLEDVFFDQPPRDGDDLIEWIRTFACRQRDRAIETQARMAYHMQAQTSYRVVQVDSGASQSFQERIRGVLATRGFSIDEDFRQAARIADDSSPAKQVVRHIKKVNE